MAHTSSGLATIISDIKAVNHQTPVASFIDGILKRIYTMELPGTEHIERYMRYKWRMNHRPNTIRASLLSVRSFLTFYSALGKRHLHEITSDDLEAFVEHEQDRRLKVTSVRTKFKYLCAFLRYLVDQDII